MKGLDSDTGCPMPDFASAKSGRRMLNFLDQKIHDALVDIIPAEPRIAVGGQHLEDAVVQFENGKIERSAAQIVNGDFRALVQAIQAVGQRGGGRLVHNAFDGKAGQFACLLGRVPLGIIEICGNRDDRAGYRLRRNNASASRFSFFRISAEISSGDIVAAMNRNGDRTRAGIHRIRYDHFFRRNVRGPPPHETFDGINRFRRFENPNAIGGVSRQSQPRWQTENERPMA